MKKKNHHNHNQQQQLEVSGIGGQNCLCCTSTSCCYLGGGRTIGIGSGGTNISNHSIKNNSRAAAVRSNNNRSNIKNKDKLDEEEDDEGLEVNSASSSRSTSASSCSSSSSSASSCSPSSSLPATFFLSPSSSDPMKSSFLSSWSCLSKSNIVRGLVVLLMLTFASTWHSQDDYRSLTNNSVVAGSITSSGNHDDRDNGSNNNNNITMIKGKRKDRNKDNNQKKHIETVLPSRHVKPSQEQTAIVKTSSSAVAATTSVATKPSVHTTAPVLAKDDEAGTSRVADRMKNHTIGATIMDPTMSTQPELEVEEEVENASTVEGGDVTHFVSGKNDTAFNTPEFLRIPVEEWGPIEEAEFRTFHTKAYPIWWEEKTEMLCPHKILKTRRKDRLKRRLPNVTIYTPTYMDRSGSVIKRMIDTYAYAIHYGFRFGGGIDRTRDPEWKRKRAIHEDYIETIGLSSVLKFSTPERGDSTAYNVNWNQCVNGIRLTSTFLKHLRSKRQQRGGKKRMAGIHHDKSRPQQVAVHVRRGDAQPCTEEIFSLRYQPNSYFLEVIKTYTDYHTANVTLFSESDSFEPFEVFRELGYGLALDGDVYEAWKAMMAADVLILSPGSHFSDVPALLNPNLVYTYLPIEQQQQQDQQIIDDFIQVNDDIIRHSQTVLQTLIRDTCETYLDRHPEHKATHTLW